MNTLVRTACHYNRRDGWMEFKEGALLCLCISESVRDSMGFRNTDVVEGRLLTP